MLSYYSKIKKNPIFIWGEVLIFFYFFRKERESMSKKYIFVTGGVVSGLGKGITAASLRTTTKKQRL